MRDGLAPPFSACLSPPSVQQQYLDKLGFPVSMFRFHDVMSTEEWALEMIPQPALAVVMLFPIKDASEKHKDDEDARIKASGQVVAPSLYFTKQIIGNACGTIGILHSVANVSAPTGGMVPLREGSYFDKYITRTLAMTPEERAVALEEDDEIEAEHGEISLAGQSEVVQDVNTHFVAFVEKEGSLYELDGRKSFPINHGPTTPETLLKDAVRVVGEFMARDEGEMRFTITALAPSVDEE